MINMLKLEIRAIVVAANHLAPRLAATDMTTAARTVKINTVKFGANSLAL